MGIPDSDRVQDLREEEGYRCRSDLLATTVAGKLIVPQKNGDHEIAETLASSCVHHHLTPAPSLFPLLSHCTTD